MIAQAAALAATNRTIDAMEAQDKVNAGELAALRKRVADLEAQRRKDIDDIASGRTTLSELAAERAAGQQRADALQVRLCLFHVPLRASALTFRTAALRALASILSQAELDAALAEAARLKTMMSDLAKEFQNYKDMTGIATGALEQQQAADAARVAQLAAQAQNDADALARANKMLEDLAKEYAGYKATTSKVIAEWEATSAEDNKRIEALTQRATGETRRADTAEAALKKASDELATLSTRHADLTAAKAGADKRASELELTVFKHAAEIDALRKQLQEAADALTAARADAKADRDASEQTVAALSAQTKRDQEELERSRKAADELGTTLKSLAQEYQVYKIAAEKVRKRHRPSSATKTFDFFHIHRFLLPHMFSTTRPLRRRPRRSGKWRTRWLKKSGGSRRSRPRSGAGKKNSRYPGAAQRTWRTSATRCASNCRKRWTRWRRRGPTRRRTVKPPSRRWPHSTRRQNGTKTTWQRRGAGRRMWRTNWRRCASSWRRPRLGRPRQTPAWWSCCPCWSKDVRARRSGTRRSRCVSMRDTLLFSSGPPLTTVLCASFSAVDTTGV